MTPPPPFCNRVVQKIHGGSSPTMVSELQRLSNCNLSSFVDLIAMPCRRSLNKVCSCYYASSLPPERRVGPLGPWGCRYVEPRRRPPRRVRLVVAEVEGLGGGDEVLAGLEGGNLGLASEQKRDALLFFWNFFDKSVVQKSIILMAKKVLSQKKAQKSCQSPKRNLYRFTQSRI